MAAIPTSTPDPQTEDKSLAGLSIPGMGRKNPQPPPARFMDDENALAGKQLSPTPENKQASEVPMNAAQQAYLDGYLSKQAGPIDAAGSLLAGAPAKATGRAVPAPAVVAPSSGASTDTSAVAPMAGKAPTTRGNTALQDARQANAGLAAKRKMIEEVE